MAKKKMGGLTVFLGGLTVGAVIMYIGKDKIKGLLLNKAENLGGAARARRIIANRARLRSMGYRV